MAAITASVAVGAASAYSASRSAKKGRKAMRKAQDKSIDEQRRQYDQTREDYMPYLDAGKEALMDLSDPNGNFLASPDYEFRRDEGMRDIGNQFAARGGGGNAMKALNEHNSNLASGEFGNWFNRRFNVANMGRGAAQGVAGAGQNMANTISAGYQNYGVNAANSIQNQYDGMTNAVTGGISNVLYEYGKNRVADTARPKYDFQGRRIQYD